MHNSSSALDVAIKRFGNDSIFTLYIKGFKGDCLEGFDCTCNNYLLMKLLTAFFMISNYFKYT